MPLSNTLATSLYSKYSIKKLISQVARYLTIFLFLSIWVCCTKRTDDIISTDPQDFPNQFKLQSSYLTKDRDIIFIDLDDDGLDEQLSCSASKELNGCNIVATEPNGSVIDQINFPPSKQLEFQFAYDLNTDHDKDLFVITRKHDTLYLCVVDIYHSVHSYLLKKYPLSLSDAYITKFLPDQNIHLEGIIDSKETGSKILVGSFVSFLSKGPRGIIAFDLESGRMLWRYQMGPVPTPPIISNLDRNGPVYIFAGCTSPDNGVEANGTDDNNTYIFGLSALGTPLWKPLRIGGGFAVTRIFLEDMNQDGIKEILCLFASANKNIEKSFITLVNPLNGVEIGTRKEFNEKILLPQKSPIIRYSHQKYLTICTLSGSVYLLDDKFEFIIQKRFPVEAENIQLVDIDDNGTSNVVISLKTKQTVILDHRLEPLALIDGLPDVSSSHCKDAGKKLIVLKDGGTMMIGKWEVKPISYTKWFQIAGLLVLIILLSFLTFKGFFYWQVLKKTWDNAGRVPLMLLGRKGNLKHVNEDFYQYFSLMKGSVRHKKWDCYFMSESYKPVCDFITKSLLSNKFEEGYINIDSSSGTINLLVRVHRIVLLNKFNMCTVIAIFDITERIRNERLINWTAVVQNLAHEMKTPLSTMWFTIERIRQESMTNKVAVDQKYLLSIEEEIQRLNNYVKGFMKLANINPPDLQDTDINQSLQDLLNKYKEKLPKTIILKEDYAVGLPVVKLDVNLFTIVVINLFDNAVSAMKGNGILRVATYLARNLSKDFLELTITDTGCGISKEDIPKIFQPFFSKSENGTGLGLVYTKKIVEEHNGSISFTTREGLGTEFTVKLPVALSSLGGKNV